MHQHGTDGSADEGYLGYTRTMRWLWIATCAASVIGGFFVVLQLAWLCHLEPDWLPFPAHVLGAAIAGAALVRASPMRSLREPVAGGLVAIAVLAAVAFGLPHAFGWVPLRSAHPGLTALAIAAASAAACAGGAWLADRIDAARPSIAAVIATSMTAAACTTFLGPRVAVELGLPPTMFALMAFSCAAAFAATWATHALLAGRHVGACVIGVVLVFALQVIRQLTTKFGAPLDKTALLLVLPILAAAAGARAGRAHAE